MLSGLDGRIQVPGIWLLAFCESVRLRHTLRIFLSLFLQPTLPLNYTANPPLVPWSSGGETDKESSDKVPVKGETGTVFRILTL